MSTSFEIELSGMELTKIEALAKVSGKSTKMVVEDLVRERLEDRAVRLQKISQRLMNEKIELYRRLAQ